MLPNYNDYYAMSQPNNQLAGRYVPSIDSIMAKDVPMTGYYAIFPKQDMTEIYAKNWNGQGTIDTIVYRPVIEPKEIPNVPTSGYSDIISGMNRIVEKLDELLKGGSTHESTAISSESHTEKS